MNWNGMRGALLLCAMAGAGVILTGCASKPTATAPAPSAAKHIERVILDYKGATIGAEVPAWIEAAIDGDSSRLARDKRFEGRTIVIDYGIGQNLDLLRSWVNNFNVQASVSRRITNMVDASFGGEEIAIFTDCPSGGRERLRAIHGGAG